MSLIHAALRTLETGQPAALPPRAPRRLALALGLGVLATGGLLGAAWLTGRSDAAASSPRAPSVARALPAPASRGQDPAPPPADAAEAPSGHPTDRDLASAMPAPAPAQAQAAPPPLSAPAVADADVPPPSPAAAPARSPAVAIAVTTREAAEATASPGDSADADPQAVATAIAALESAMHQGDGAAARAQLDALAQLLPARSLTLLRMRAWFAHRNGDADEAIAQYRAILERVPHDAAVAINLALLEAERGDLDSARARLHALRAQGVRLPELSEALARLEGSAP